MAKSKKKTVQSKLKIKSKSKSKSSKSVKASVAKSFKASAKPSKSAKKLNANAKPASAAAKNLDFSKILTPLDDRLLVLLVEMERRTAGGLYLPDTVTDSSGNMRGQVVSVGRGRRDKKGKLHPMDVSLGDEVVFNQYSGNKISLMGKNLIMLHEAEVMGIVTK